jgi:outer membrane protein TolC
MAAPLATPTAPPEIAGPQPVDAYIRRALAENRTVQAAYHNVEALKFRVPQVMTLDDPVASNAIFPIPAVGPQYSLMGYNPYNLTLAQQFPWFGTLRLRGQAAEADVQVALAELAAAQLDAVAAVKRSYYDLYANLKAEDYLKENRKLLEDFRTVARSRLESGGSQQDVLRAEVLINELDRQLANNQQGVVTARSALARQIHMSPEADLRTLPELTLGGVPAEIDRLTSLAIAARPELKGRLAAVARDETAIELAKKRFYPSYSLGLTYMDMEKTNAQTPLTASGVPNVGLFVAFNLPVYRAKYRAGVCEAKERALSDAKLYEAQRDETRSEIADLTTQARVQQNVLGLLRDQILPRTRQALENAGSDYGKGNADFATLTSALREVLQIQLQIAQVEAELGKALAMLERAVGCQINEHPPASATTPDAGPPAPPAATPGPFRPTSPATPGAGPTTPEPNGR